MPTLTRKRYYNEKTAAEIYREPNEKADEEKKEILSKEKKESSQEAPDLK